MGGTTAVMPVIRLFGAKLKQVGVTSFVEREQRGVRVRVRLGQPTKEQRQTNFFSLRRGGSGPTSTVTITNCIGGWTRSRTWSSTTPIGRAALGRTARRPGARNLCPRVSRSSSGPVQGLVPIVASSYLYYSEITVAELQDLYVCGANGKHLDFHQQSHHLQLQRRNEWNARAVGQGNWCQQRPSVTGGLWRGSASPQRRW